MQVAVQGQGQGWGWGQGQGGGWGQRHGSPLAGEVRGLIVNEDLSGQRQVKWAALEAAGSSTRGSGWAPSGTGLSPWEDRAAQGRQARPAEAPEPSWGAAKKGALTMREARGRRSRWRIPPPGSRAAAGRCRSRAASAPPGATRAPRAAWRPRRRCGAARRPRSAERACSSCPSQRRALGLGLRARRGDVGVGRRVGPRASREGWGLWRRAACPASTREGSGAAQHLRPTRPAPAGRRPYCWRTSRRAPSCPPRGAGAEPRAPPGAPACRASASPAPGSHGAGGTGAGEGGVRVRGGGSRGATGSRAGGVSRLMGTCFRRSACPSDMLECVAFTVSSGRLRRRK